MGIVESEIISKLRNTLLDMDCSGVIYYLLISSYIVIPMYFYIYCVALMGKISSAAAAVPGCAAVTQRAGMNLSRRNLARSQFRDVLCAFRL